MKNLKYSIVIFLILFLSISAYSQPVYKKVKNADDVISNCIISLGGYEKLSDIKSVEFNGTMNFANMNAEIYSYHRDKINYVDIKSPFLKLRMCITDTSGWMFQNNELKIISRENLKKDLERMEYAGIDFYLKYKDKGLTAELIGKDTINNKKVYKIKFLKSGRMIRTDYIDYKKYFLLRSEMPKPDEVQMEGDKIISEFGDYKEVPGTGIMRPYTIYQTFAIQVTEYKFNTEIDNKLLEIPAVPENQDDEE